MYEKALRTGLFYYLLIKAKSYDDVMSAPALSL